MNEKPLETVLSAAVLQALAAAGIDTDRAYGELGVSPQGKVRAAVLARNDPIGEIFLALAPWRGYRVADLSLSAATRAALSNDGYATVDGIAAVAPASVLRSGPHRHKRHHEVIDWLFRLASLVVPEGWGERPQNEALVDLIERARDAAGQLIPSALPPTALLVAWASSCEAPVTTGAQVISVLERYETLLPDIVRDIEAHAAELDVGPLDGALVAVAQEFGQRPAAALETAVALLGARTEGTIYIQRVLTPSPPTLATLGKKHDLTGERIRQLQVRGEAYLKSLLASPRYQALNWRAAGLGRRLGLAVPEEALRADREWVSLVGSSGAGSVRELLLLHLLGARWDHGWLVRAVHAAPTVGNARALTRDGCVLGNRQAVEAVMCEAGIAVAHHEPWLAACGRIGQLGDVYVVWPDSLEERARLVLAHHGGPMDLDQLIGLVGPGMNRQGARYRLLGALVRTGLNEVALPGEGYSPYESISDAIALRISRGEGQALLAVLQAELPEQYGVSRDSVTAYARSPRFEIAGGWVRFRATENPYVPAGMPSDHKFVLRGAGGRELVVVIALDENALRGYSNAIPEAVATSLDVAPGARRSFTGSHSPLSVFWNPKSNTGPLLSSIRTVAGDMGAQPGDAVCLALDPDAGRWRGWRVAKPSEVASDRRRAAAQLLEGEVLDVADAARRLWVTGVSSSWDWYVALCHRCPLPGWF